MGAIRLKNCLELIFHNIRHASFRKRVRTNKIRLTSVIPSGGPGKTFLSISNHFSKFRVWEDKWYCFGVMIKIDAFFRVIVLLVVLWLFAVLLFRWSQLWFICSIFCLLSIFSSSVFHLFANLLQRKWVMMLRITFFFTNTSSTFRIRCGCCRSDGPINIRTSHPIISSNCYSAQRYKWKGYIVPMISYFFRPHAILIFTNVWIFMWFACLYALHFRRAYWSMNLVLIYSKLLEFFLDANRFLIWLDLAVICAFMRHIERKFYLNYLCTGCQLYGMPTYLMSIESEWVHLRAHSAHVIQIFFFSAFFSLFSFAEHFIIL